jgi:co-chaperonin GroES (HSP10)
MKLIPNKNHVAVVKITSPQRSGGGISLGERTDYRVISVGENVKFCKSMDVVVLDITPKPIQIDSTEVYIVHEDDVVAKFEENKEI